MKLLHTSDLHIGLSLFKTSLLEYQSDLGNILRKCGEDNNADCIIIAGDVYDSYVSSADAVNCWDRICSQLFSGEKSIPVIVISGNHDSSVRLSVCSDILEKSGLYIRGTLSDYLRPVTVGNAEIFCIPFFNIAEISAMFPDKKIDSMTAAFSALTDEIRAVMTPDMRHIIAAHCFMENAHTSADSERATITAGTVQMTDAAVFSGFDYAALGHLHRPQTVSQKNGTVIRYSGTPMPYSFSEGGQEKSFSLFDTETGRLDTIPVVTSPPLRLVTLTDTYEQLLARADEIDSDTYVRLIITDKTSLSGIDKELTEKYPRRLTVQYADRTSDAPSPLDSDPSMERLSMETLSSLFMNRLGLEPLTDEMKEWIGQAQNYSENE